MVSYLNIFVLKFADFALQNMVETTLPDGLDTSGRRGGGSDNVDKDFCMF